MSNRIPSTYVLDWFTWTLLDTNSPELTSTPLGCTYRLRLLREFGQFLALLLHLLRTEVNRLHY